jgi:hypothetical protein
LFLQEQIKGIIITVETKVIAEVPLATPTMQAGQESWVGLATRRVVGVWVFDGEAPDSFARDVFICTLSY